MELVAAGSEEEMAAVRRLFREYAESLPIDLGFQGFEQEVAGLPGAYAAPRGGLWLAREDGLTIGCIGLRPFAAGTGELKRLYVVPSWRGRGVARALVAEAIRAARTASYAELVLDTLASMHSAVALYRSFGFAPTLAYYPNPLAEALYFRLVLRPQSAE